MVKTGVNLRWQAEMEAKQRLSQVLSKNATWILTSDGAGQKARDKKCESVQSGENDTDTRGGLALSTPVYSAVSLPLCPSVFGRLTLPFIRLTAHRRRDEWQRGEGWKSRMKGEGRMSSRRTSKCSPADLLEESEKKNGFARKTWLATALMHH